MPDSIVKVASAGINTGAIEIDAYTKGGYLAESHKYY
jgi:hypothetical protein